MLEETYENTANCCVFFQFNDHEPLKTSCSYWLSPGELSIPKTKHNGNTRKHNMLKLRRAAGLDSLPSGWLPWMSILISSKVPRKLLGLGPKICWQGFAGTTLPSRPFKGLKVNLAWV